MKWEADLMAEKQPEWLNEDDLEKRLLELQARLDAEPYIPINECARILGVDVEWLEQVLREAGFKPTAHPRDTLN